MCAATPEAAKVTCGTRFKSDKDVCETCDSDGCNDASQYGPVALLTVIPVAIMKVLTRWTLFFGVNSTYFKWITQLIVCVIFL